jgi:hypothetical protein
LKVGDYKEGYYIGVEVDEDDAEAEKPFYGPNVWPAPGNYSVNCVMKIKLFFFFFFKKKKITCVWQNLALSLVRKLHYCFIYRSLSFL